VHGTININIKLVNLNSLSLSKPVKKFKAVPITGLNRPKVFQEIKVPKFHDNGTG